MLPFNFDYLTLGSTPSSEPYQQLVDCYNHIVATKEARIFKQQLIRQFSDGLDGRRAYFTIKHFSHDFGTYCEVVIIYDNNDEEAINFAFNVKANIPEYWDGISKQQLSILYEEVPL